MENSTNQNEVNENTTAPDENVGNPVNMTQDQLNELINKKYAKGAEKAKSDLLGSLGVDNIDSLKELIEAKKQQDEANKTELEKLSEQLNSTVAEKQSLLEQMEQMKFKTEVSTLSAQNGIKDVEVFEVMYEKASKNEGFEKDTFINQLKETRPYLFGQETQTKPKVDNTSNNKQNPSDRSTQIAKAQQLAKEGKAGEAKKILDSLYK